LIAHFAIEAHRLQAQVQLIGRSLLCTDLTAVLNFRWDEATHGAAENFLILVEDVDDEVTLFHDNFALRQQ